MQKILHCNRVNVTEHHHSLKIRYLGGKGFTLVELLIVILIMGLVYALSFNAIPTMKNGNTEAEDTIFENPLAYFRTLPGYLHKSYEIDGLDDGTAYLITEGRIIRKLELPPMQMYTLNPDETLSPTPFTHRKVGTEEFRPLFVLRCTSNGLMEPAIMQYKEKWYYFHPFLPVQSFDDPEAMIASIRQTAYLPDKAGYAR